MSSRCDSNTNTLVGLQNIETFSELYIFLCSLFLKYSIVLKLSIALKQWLVYDLFQILRCQPETTETVLNRPYRHQQLVRCVTGVTPNK